MRQIGVSRAIYKMVPNGPCLAKWLELISATRAHSFVHAVRCAKMSPFLTGINLD